MVNQLETRSFGNTGMTPRALGLGCAFFGGAKSSDGETVEEVYEAATTRVDPEVWADFRAEFGVGVQSNPGR